MAPNISGSSLGILKMVHQVRLMMFSLKMVDKSMSLFSLSNYMGGVGGGWWWVAYMILVSAPVPFGFNWG